tara:strand:- start:279 stop:389 length:111 start_codon:yes stop_codon:yes gene_type:complete
MLVFAGADAVTPANKLEVPSIKQEAEVSISLKIFIY